MKIKNFNDVREFLSDIPNINAGGCGVSTLAMFLWLKKNKGVQKGLRVVYLYEDDSHDRAQKYQNSRFLKGVHPQARSCSHCVLTYDGETFFDCAKEVHIDHFKNKQIIPYKKTESFLRQSLLNQDDWNVMFSRKVYKPMIERVLNINLNL